MELLFLEMLQQRATCTMDDALRHTGGARGVEHVHGVIERQAGELDPLDSGMRSEELPEQLRVGNVRRRMAWASRYGTRTTRSRSANCPAIAASLPMQSMRLPAYQ